MDIHKNARLTPRSRAELVRRVLKTTTFLAALRHDKMTAPCVFDGAINGACFLAWVEQALVPTFAKGDIIIMDNLGSHKVAGAREAIKAVGAIPLYLLIAPIPPGKNAESFNQARIPQDTQKLVDDKGYGQWINSGLRAIRELGT